MIALGIKNSQQISSMIGQEQVETFSIKFSASIEDRISILIRNNRNTTGLDHQI